MESEWKKEATLPSNSSPVVSGNLLDIPQMALCPDPPSRLPVCQAYYRVVEYLVG